MNKKKLSEAAKLIIEGLGEDITREGLIRTPFRVSRDWPELFDGYNKKPEDILNRVFTEKYKGMVVVKDIEFYSFCEHHILPFFGKAHLGYIGEKKVIGLDKLVKLVWMYAKRLQNQERITQQVADALMNCKLLKPLGVIVVIEAQHLCMMMRGTNVQNSKTITSEVRGYFNANKDGCKDEFLNLIRLNGSTTR